MQLMPLLSLLAAAAAPGPAISDVQLSAPAVPAYERLEVACGVRTMAANPFDPRETEVEGRFTGPGDRSVTMPGFLYQECRRRRDEAGAEVVEPVGEPGWRVRFAASQPGRWQAVVHVRDAEGTAESPPQSFEVTAPVSPGYIRRAPGSDYFRFDDGTPFFPIGENVAWAGKRGTYDFDDWLPAAGQAGLNLARIWLQWNHILSLEHKGTGAGRYDLANAWRVDYVLDLARRCGVRVFFTLDSPEPYQKEHYWLGKLTAKPWENCPHNAANGGPLREPAEFYTTEEGHRLIRQRLRYIVARWGWDPNLFCWELWNELNCFPGWEKLLPEIARWHVEMAAELRRLDPHAHLVTTSFGFADGHPDIWHLPELDLVQSHVYGPTDMARELPEVTTRMRARYGRPHLIGEFGPPLLQEYMDLRRLDPEGRYLHAAIWSTTHAGGAGTALTWWWDNYVHPNHLYRVFTPLARYCAGVPWTTAGFRPAAARIEWVTPPPPQPPRDLTLECRGSPQVAGVLSLDPAAPPASLGRFYLYGQAQRDQQKPVEVKLRRRDAGPLVLRIGRVWVLGILEVKLDGVPVLRREFPAGEGKGPWVKSEFAPQWQIWGADYEADVDIAVPAGDHTVELYNSGRDGITIDRLSLPAYVSDERPHLRCLGLLGSSLALLWLQNSEQTLAALIGKREVAPIAGVRVTVTGVPAGPCRIEWWDTTSGSVTATTEGRAEAVGLVLELPPLASDVAAKVRW